MADQSMQTNASIFWYDLETTGIRSKWDRVVQFAGIRTTEDLKESEETVCTYVRLSDEILPDPNACLVTGLAPQQINQEGISEPLALSHINRIFSVQGTCVAGFNNLRFDDEFIRFGFYRNFIDPYGREWRNQNSRWDLIDLVRATAALRPEGISWPEQDNLPSFKLEHLSSANELAHGQAHDALSDVRATIALARLIRQKQPRLYDYYYKLRRKSAIQPLLLPLGKNLLLHVSRMYPRERNCLAPVISVARHPTNTNSIIVLDLASEIDAVLEWPAERIAESLFSAGDQFRPGLKEVRMNRCPFLAPLSTVRKVDAQRLALDVDQVERNFARVTGQPDLAEKISKVYEHPEQFETEDVEGQLYDSFISDSDRHACDEVWKLFHACIDPGAVCFDDPRLTELLVRFRARNRIEWLAPAELEHWKDYLRDSVCSAKGYHGRSLDEFEVKLAALKQVSRSSLLARLESYGAEVKAHMDELLGVCDRSGSGSEV